MGYKYFTPFFSKKSRVHEYVERVGWSHIYLPSVVVAEMLRGRIDFALKATPEQMQNAHQQMMNTLRYLDDFKIVVFDDECAEAMGTLQKKLSTKRRYNDVMIASVAIAKNMILVTRNQKDFQDILPQNQLVNWVDK